MLRKNKVKLIKSSTMKCLLCNNIKNTTFNTKNTLINKVIYKRNEHEGIISLMEDFSILKMSKNNNKICKSTQRFKTPISIRWDITYQCNFQCKHCYSSCSSDGINTLTTKECKRMLDIFENQKVQFVQILGGEPLIRNDIYELIQYALTKKYIFSLNTNASLLYEDDISRLVKIGLKYIQISLHGFEKEHEYLTNCKGSYIKTLNAIKLLIKNGVSVSISCVASDINNNNIIEFLKYLIKIKVGGIQVLTPLNEGRAKTQNVSLSSKNANTLKQKLIKFKNDNKNINIDLPGFDIDIIDGMVIKYKNNPSYEFMFGCSGGVSSMRINPLGQACICVGSANKSFGNILKESLTDIMKKMYKWRLKNRPKMCSNCKYYLAECQGGCYLRYN